MGQLQCPICYSPLETRDVSPCMICGGWPEISSRLDPNQEFREWRLPNDQTLVLCRGCELEEFMVDGGWGYRFGLGNVDLPINALHYVRRVPSSSLAKDKFCPHCNLRLAFLNVMESF